ERFPGVASFIDDVLDACRRDGYVSTALGRKRHIEGVREAAERHRASQLNMPERIAVNTVIQGTAADLIKRAMIAVHERLAQQNHPAKMLLQIHDELIFETPERQCASLAELVREEMTRVIEWSTPLKVDISSGRHWSDCH
ncbi:MAG TPA: DNA polymerase I, partial [Planctomycetaceae bacterium]|nr:DNA polymerase I [Planctomycetaceae bacterium]